jgi:hypothetical protein
MTKKKIISAFFLPLAIFATDVVSAQSRHTRASMTVTATVVRSCAVTPGNLSVHVSCATGAGLRPVVSGDRGGESVVLQRAQDYFVAVPANEPVMDAPGAGPAAIDERTPTLLFTISF